MNTIFDFAVERVRKGARFRVLFQTRTLVVGGKKVIDNGKFEGKLGVGQVSYEKAFACIEGLYAQYKHSVPSERSERKRRKYFKALPEAELSDEDMAYGVFRDIAQITLELTVLCFILNGSLIWDESKMGRWFWQSPNDKDLIILREWVENNNNN